MCLPTDRSVNPARKSGAHGRTRTCTFLIRSQELYPVELRVRCWLPFLDAFRTNLPSVVATAVRLNLDLLRAPRLE